MKRILLLVISLALLSAACLGSAPARPSIPTSTTDPMPTRPGPTPKPLEGKELTVDQRMLQSSALWDSLIAEATVTNLGDVQHVQVWIDQPGRFKLAVRPQAGGPQQLTVSDGRQVRMNTGEVVSAAPDLNQPFTPPAGPSDTIFGHPLGSALGYPLIGDVLFPVGLAQRSGHYEVIGQDVVAGRSATIIDWSYVAGTVNDRLWVDNETGVVLRQQTFGKGGSTTPETEIVIQMIQFNIALEDELFNVNQ